MPDTVTVAIPTLNAGPELARTLDAVRAQRLERRALQVLVCDSGSSDGTPVLAAARGAEVITIPAERFSHGGTRNLLMSSAAGDHVAFLSQDAVPASEHWLERLLSAFELAADVGLTFGPYLPRAEASLSVARELTDWFASLSPDGRPRIDVLAPGLRDLPQRAFMGPLGFFTSANGCVARAAWERVPFRDIAYAEDHMLAQDMLRAGFAKVFVPDAAVIHSHDYSPWQWLRRSFDEARAIREVYGWRVTVRDALRNVRGRALADWRRARWPAELVAGGHPPQRPAEQALGARGAGRPAQEAIGAQRPPWPPERLGGWRLEVLGAALIHHAARGAGELLGANADALPRRLVAHLSLERRAR
ncbi:MAG TPA: glycosyltransferase family 2 protein [Solirubrobacteraceae bacterium]|nr:glycosyltransferase family 2 protein [Solirubrobacteraceae bacterium]